MSSLKKWLRPYDEKQHAWAVSYLEKKNVRLYSRPDRNYEYLLEIDKISQNNPHYKLAVNSMKSAWRQQKLREKRRDKTEFSLVISNEKKKRLSTLAKQRGKTIGETLEEIINYESQRQLEIKEEIKKEKEIIKQKLESTRGHYNARVHKKNMTIHTLLYALEESIENMLNSEIDAIKAYQPTAYEHTGTKEYKELRLAEEKEKINKYLKKIHTWEPNYFPLDIQDKIRIREIINGKQ
ncbi:hypothetical protein HBJ58_22585 [Halomonas desiderata]|uniref:hypothetical protein n=1 Tax=Billgrantia desiderata TaxID=52021 RepID=UPI00174DC88C|nr:hypothetical protein [Halomonas desiderata]